MSVGGMDGVTEATASDAFAPCPADEALEAFRRIRRLHHQLRHFFGGEVPAQRLGVW